MEVRVSVVSIVKCAEVSVEFSGTVCGFRCHVVDRKWTSGKTNVAFSWQILNLKI